LWNLPKIQEWVLKPTVDRMLSTDSGQLETLGKFEVRSFSIRFGINHEITKSLGLSCAFVLWWLYPKPQTAGLKVCLIGPISHLSSVESLDKALCLSVFSEALFSLAKGGVVNSPSPIAVFLSKMSVQHFMKEDITDHILGDEPAVEPPIDDDSAVGTVIVP